MTMHFVRLRIEGDDFPDAVLFFSAADPVQASVRAFAFADRMKATHVSSGEVSAESLDWMMKQLQADAERRDELVARLGGDILRGMDPDKVMRWARLSAMERDADERRGLYGPPPLVPGLIPFFDLHSVRTGRIPVDRPNSEEPEQP